MSASELVAGRVLGQHNLYRAEPREAMYMPPVVSTETCHVLPDIGNGPEVWHYHDIIVCDFCEKSWYVDVQHDSLIRDSFAFWHPVEFYMYKKKRYAASLLETARRQRTEGYFN